MDNEKKRFLVVYAHPSEESFGSQLHRVVVGTLAGRGFDVDDCNLYGESFQPAMSHEEWRVYGDPARNGEQVTGYVQRLRQCNGLVFVYPTWNYGQPAILKGYIDRVWLPGVAFDVVGGKVISRLRHIDRLAVVTTYGSPWWINRFVLGDPNRRTLMAGIRRLLARDVRVRWIAQYGMDTIKRDQAARFLKRVEKEIGTL
jgi:NAD(P)H dehydrogenase (quinone)